ncbi:PAS domain-containing sensor histidine kinase [Azospirillum sp. TSH58]|uniref:PAS-domain containing protein n=1 Tax=Azospirillum sp. TSH58 TaxID=664962 RepID=UPI000D5FF942|nr:PAS-domain containing protein [Azospirillum sp. TSH58]AWJ83773.1 PAS domain-containing sensor histidine kinase [Azospirillum sp. TSH58]MCR6630267.1 PAS-domain containing protein [Magnetospirillum sp.]PWC62726.1 histidine kinase [Azospirillum sp. TSH58]
MTVIEQAWKTVPTVSAKFLLILIPILILTTLGFSSIFFYGKYKDLRGALRDRIEAVAEINAVALSSSLWAVDVPAIRNIIQAISVNRELLCIEVADELADGRFAWPDADCRSFAGRETVRRPIQVQNRRLGTLTLHFSYAPVDEQIRQEMVNTLWLLLLMLVGTLVTALTAHRLTIGVPLGRLIASIRTAEQEHLRQRVQWSSADELGRVIAAYNGMLARLDEEEAALRQSEERLGLAITATRSSVWDYDLRTGQYWWSKEFPALLGYGPAELAMTARTWESLIHPEERRRVIAESRSRVRDKDSAHAAVYRMRRRDGGWSWIEDRATALRDGEGTAVRLTGTMSDVTERMQAERDLARERNVLQITLDNTDQGIIMVDRNLRVVMSNRRAAELLDVPAAFLAGNPLFPEIIRLQRAQGAFEDFSIDPDLELDETAVVPDLPFAFKRRRPDGTIIEVRSNPLPEGGFVRTFTDVTVEARSAEEVFHAMEALETAYADLKETQDSLVQAEKMASLALLVAGVAHEINTPVGIAYSCSTHLAAKTRTLTEAFAKGALKKSDLTAYVAAAGESSRLIEQNLTRAAELIQSFKRVAVDQTSQERRRFDLRSYLDEIITSLGPRLRKSPHRMTVTCPDGITMDGYPGALSQVITNLVINALTHAFPDGREGAMALTVEELPDGELDIRFADDGVGIAPDNLPKVFEPFFTTKRGTGGSGLGLHIVFNLVTQSLGGRISVESPAPRHSAPDNPAGGGTGFLLRIPVTAPRTAAAAGKDPATDAA